MVSQKKQMAEMQKEIELLRKENDGLRDDLDMERGAYNNAALTRDLYAKECKRLEGLLKSAKEEMTSLIQLNMRLNAHLYRISDIVNF